MKISGVLPVHNEEFYLPYTLNSLLSADLDELVVVLDRCRDRSVEIVYRFRDIAPFPVRVIPVEERKWSFPTAEVFHRAFSEASGDIIYALGADCVYHPGVFQINWENLDLASFPHYEHDIRSLRIRIHNYYMNFIKWILNIQIPKFTGKKKQFGIFGFRKWIFDELKDEPWDTILSEDIWFQRTAIEKLHVRYEYFPQFISLHLRPGNIMNQRKQWEHGVGRAYLNYPLWKVLVHSIVFLKPMTLGGFLYARRNALKVY